MKIGVIADTHVPKAMPALPARVKEIFRDVDLILHAGDVCTLAVLNELEAITITMAVSGNRDDEMVRKYVESSRVVEFANRKIGMAHGHRGLINESLQALQSRLLGRPRYEQLYKLLSEQFPNVHCIVFGHTHQPYSKLHNGVLLFNPGAASPGYGVRPSVGILDMTPKSISGRILYLS
jgi:hypothetical protein